MKRNHPFLLTALALVLGTSSQAQTAPTITPPVPAADRARELPAVAVSSSVPVDLSKAYNKLGFVADKAIFDGLAGFDSGGTAFSADDIKSTLEANGVTFKMGVAGDNNIVELQGETLKLPTGKYQSLWMLGAAVNGNQRNVSFTVNYTDGSQQVLAQNFSDWFSPQEFPGESQAVKAQSRALLDGKRDERPFNLYSYGFALDANKTVQSLVLPKNMNVKIAALSLAK